MNPLTKPTNPLLKNVKLPGRVFQLPSKGLFYKPGTLRSDIQDGEVEVHPMSALAEMKMRSADLLYSGKVIREVCEECVPSIIKAEDLISQDVDALFTFLRVVTYGSDHSISSIHTCKDAKPHDYSFSIEALLSNPRNKVLDNKEFLYKTKLPNGQLVHLKPNTYMHAVSILHYKQQLMLNKTNTSKVEAEKSQEEITIMDMLAVIDAVEVEQDEGESIIVKDKLQIIEWIKLLPTVLFKEVVEAASRSNDWGYKFKTNVTCKDCGETYEHDLELDPINFFFG